jgi:hypothetical protein
MAVTRINNNQITDSSAGNVYVGINASTKVQDYSITAGKIANSLVYGSDLTVSGNLTVNGQTTTIDTVSTVIEDPIIVLASNQTGSPSVDIGFIGERGTSNNIAFIWDESSTEFATTFTSSLVTNTTVTISSYANFHTNDANIGGNITINGTTSLVGNISSALNVTGNITGGNLLTPGVVTATGNITGGNVTTAGRVTATGNVTGGNLVTTGITSTGSLTASTTISATGNVSGGNLTTGGNVVATGNVVGGNLTTAGLISAGTTITATGNITGGNLTTAGLTSTGTLSSSGNANVGNLGTAGQVTATGNITGGNLTTAGITSTGSLTASTTINATGNITGGNVTTAGQVVATGNVTGGNLTTAGLISAGTTITATGNITGGNLTTAGITSTGSLTASTTINATGNITGGNVSAGSGIISTTGNINGANVNASAGITAGTTITATGNITGGNLITTGVTKTGTLETTGNALIGGNLIVNGNITYINIDDLRVEDPIIILGTGPNGAPLTSDDGLDRGIFMEYYKTGLGNAFMGWDNSTGNMVIASSVNFTANDVVGVNSYGTLQAGNLYIQSAVSTGNITGGNLTTAGITNTGSLTASTTINATGNITGGNVSAGSGIISTTGNINGANVNATSGITAGTTITATGNITGGNLTTAGITSTGSLTASTTINATGNISGGNLNTGGTVNATGNVNGTGAVFSGNVTAANFIGNITGNIDAGGANTNIQFNDGDILAGSAAFTFNKTSNAVIASGNVSAGNLTTAGQVVATGNVNGGNLVTAGIASVTGNVNGGNLVTAGQVVATGNVTGGNVVAVALVTGANVTATANVTGANVVGTTSGTFANIRISTSSIDGPAAGRITINGSDIDTDFAVDGDTVANVFYVDAGTGTASFGSATQTTNALVAFNATNSILMPVGNTLQRPSTGVTGMLRFNTIADALEVYDNSQWTTVGVPSFTVIADQQFNGDGSTLVFTLGSTQTTASCIVSINGVVQLPTIAYSVSGTTLTFTEAPESGDIIDVRQITTTTTVTTITNVSGNALIGVSDTTNDVSVTGDLVPTANVTFDLGSSTNRWKDGYFSGSSLILGNVVMKNVAGGNSIGFFGPDGTTPATIAASSIDTTQIANGTSSLAVIASGGNIRANIAGTTVQTISAGLVAITGDLSVTGNATLSGNILGDRVQNGTTSFDIQTPSGNANITIGATSNVAVFSTTGLAVAGTVSVSGTGNVTGANIIATADVFTPEIVKTGSNAVGNIGQSSNYFNTVFATATSALYADLAEKYIADAEYSPGTVVVFGGDKEVTVTSTDADRAVAGVVSTNPSYIMNAGLEAEHVATVALTGRVPTRVTGTVRKGDLMVSAGNGLARSEADPHVGTVIGKALENHEGAEGVIEVVVGRF